MTPRYQAVVTTNLTVADFSVGAAMAMAEPAQFPMANYTEISRWYGALAALPAWRGALVPIPART